MTAPAPQKGPWFHRFLVHLFTVVFGVLVYWLVGFVLDDIGDWPAPDYETLVEEMRDPELNAKSLELDRQIAETQRDIAAQKARQENLRLSTESAQQTMGQLLEFQKLSLQKGVTPTEPEQRALGESQQRFLDNQARFQEIADQIAASQEELFKFDEQRRLVSQQIEEDREPIDEEFDRRRRRYEYTVAGAKLAALTPLFIGAVIVFLRKRKSLYVPFAMAFGLAVAVQVILVMHEYFPADFFKYVLIAICLAIVIKALIMLLRTTAFPRRDWLLKQYREAYEAFLCPVCNYPIRRGPLRFLFWTRRSISRLQIPAASFSAADEPYCCPSCGTPVFEECGACHRIRAALLPTCEHCGETKPVPVPGMDEESGDASPSGS